MDSSEAEPGYGGYRKGVIVCASGAFIFSAVAPRAPRKIPQRRIGTRKFLIERVTIV
jgi:hypothetical protein